MAADRNIKLAIWRLGELVNAEISSSGAHQFTTPAIAGERSEIELVCVEGTHGQPFLFGADDHQVSVDLADFFIGSCPVTHAVWRHVMGSYSNPSKFTADNRPVEHVSWDDITAPDGFMSRINASPILSALRSHLGAPEASFRLPSETEWEYAARGGVHWKDGFDFSGSNTSGEVAWHDRNSGKRTHDVGLKRPNQLGIYDMSGNVWEWCQDSFVRDIDRIPRDGSPLVAESVDRVLRGGCHHNWAVHCTVSKRYEIAHDSRDECIGFRLALR